MPRALQNDVGDLASYDLVVGGRARPEVIVKRIEVDCEINKLPRAFVTCDDGDAAAADFPLSASDEFAPGSEIEIRLGYHSQNKPVFSGIVLGQTLNIRRGGASDLVLICGDRAEALKLTHRSRAFFDTTDGDAIRTIAREAGLTADVRGGEVRRASQLQNGACDWDFILARAAANGLVVLVEGGGIVVAPPASAAAAVEVGFGDAIVALDLTLDAGAQVQAVSATAWDFKTQELEQAAASEPELPQLGRQDGAALSQVLGERKAALAAQSRLEAGALKAWADARLMRARLSLYRGSVSFAGHAGVKAGHALALAGLGKRFSGAAYVSRVRHLLESGDWLTEAFLGLDPEPAAGGAALGAALRPAAFGLQVGVVMRTDQDPDGERRLLVRVPLNPGTSDGVWMRLASPYASDGAGFAFLPEVADEVVVGFLDGDPDSGVVLGALHSSARAAPAVPDETNTIKVIATRAGLKLTFDEEKKLIRFETPGGRKAALDDDAKTLTLEDASGNRIVLGENGIAIEAEKDVTIKAGGSIAVSGQTGVKVESAGGDFAAKGMGASVSADMSAKFEGGASVELSSGGETKVQGAMVMIN